jgi:hypothetical protein
VAAILDLSLSSETAGEERRHTVGDHRALVVGRKQGGALETMWPSNQHLEAAAERVGCDPRFVGRRQLPSGRHDGGFDALAPGRGDSLRVKHRDRRQSILVDADAMRLTVESTPFGQTPIMKSILSAVPAPKENPQSGKDLGRALAIEFVELSRTESYGC